MFPINDGIEPLSWLLETSKLVKAVKFLNESGIGPVRVFEPRESDVSAAKLPIDDGIGPEN